MSHVDDGTLHGYLDGELSPAEAQGVDAHLAQCPACRERLEQERALITRAGELLALAAPPDRELPPFRAGDVKPPTRLWGRVRLPLTWAATIVLALGIGTYLGRGVKQGPPAQTASDAEPASPRARKTPIGPELAQRESRVRVRGAARIPPAAEPAVPAPAAPNEAEHARRPRDERVVTESAASGAAPVRAERAVAAVAAEERIARQRAAEGERRGWQKTSPISTDSARRLLGTDPLVVPGLPIRAIYRGRESGYAELVLVEQALDSSTVIEVVNRRRSPFAADQVVVTAAPAAQADSVSVSERARLDRARVADSLAAAPPARAAARPVRRFDNLEIQISGPLPSDSLQKLLQLVQPVKP